ncbi:hypothetical protein KKF84_05115, partial [Myxococcota bacterium]|nr:hypothetical protein [Myxococcota bacterium]
GSWYWPRSHAYGSYRRGHYPSQKNVYHHFGFRCAGTPASVAGDVVHVVNTLLRSTLSVGSLSVGSFLKLF